VEIHGNIQTNIATTMSRCGSTKIVAKNWLPIATKHVLVVLARIFCLNFTALQ
jgi:hypothetical protein